MQKKHYKSTTSMGELKKYKYRVIVNCDYVCEAVAENAKEAKQGFIDILTGTGIRKADIVIKRVKE